LVPLLPFSFSTVKDFLRQKNASATAGALTLVHSHAMEDLRSRFLDAVILTVHRRHTITAPYFEQVQHSDGAGSKFQ
jgi:hypothetical protein